MLSWCRTGLDPRLLVRRSSSTRIPCLTHIVSTGRHLYEDSWTPQTGEVGAQRNSLLPLGRQLCKFQEEIKEISRRRRQRFSGTKIVAIND